jgi:HAD superfamily hydrolase (TIGR01509 family)
VTAQINGGSRSDPPRASAAAAAAALDASSSSALCIEAVVFDMDGLLLNTELLARRALAMASEEVGLGAGEAFFAMLIGVPADGCRQLLFEHYGQSAPAESFFAAAARHLHNQIDGGEMQLRSGVIELLEHLEQRGMPRAVATSSAREKARHHLQRAGIAQRFDAIVTRDDVARGKPFPDLFLQAANRLGVLPGRCLALEDSYNGVRAAQAAGMPVVMVLDLLQPTPEMHSLCQAVVSDLYGVIPLLEAHRSPRTALAVTCSWVPRQPERSMKLESGW